MILKLNEKMIAVCGLDCGPCDIRNVTSDAEAATRIVAWFKKEGWLKENEGREEVIKRGMYCKGCRGDRSVHWSSDCWILKCGVDDKGHEFCHECSEFPCQRLEEWSQQNDNYGKALARLKKMKKKQ